MVEQTNAAMASARRADTIVHVAQEVLLRVAGHYEARRKEAARLTGEYCTEPAQILAAERASSAKYDVHVTRNGPDMIEAFVRHRTIDTADERRTKIGNDQYSCTCKMPETQKIPCRHVLALLGTDNCRDRFAHVKMSSVYTVASFRDSYGEATVSIPALTDLKADDQVKPPCLDAQKNGNRKLGRGEKEDDAYKKKSAVRRCPRCRAHGHTANGRETRRERG